MRLTLSSYTCLHNMLPYYNYFIMFIGPYGHMTIKIQWGKAWGPLVVRFWTTCCRIIITSVCSLVHVVTCRPSWIACSFISGMFVGLSSNIVLTYKHMRSQVTPQHVIHMKQSTSSTHLYIRGHTRQQTLDKIPWKLDRNSTSALA